MPKKGRGTPGGTTGGGTPGTPGGNRRRCAGETVNIRWNTNTAAGVVIEVAVSPGMLMTGCMIAVGSSFVNANACLYQQGFRLQGTASNANVATYTYVRC